MKQLLLTTTAAVALAFSGALAVAQTDQNRPTAKAEQHSPSAAVQAKQSAAVTTEPKAERSAEQRPAMDQRQASEKKSAETQAAAQPRHEQRSGESRRLQQSQTGATGAAAMPSEQHKSAAREQQRGERQQQFSGGSTPSQTGSEHLNRSDRLRQEQLSGSSTASQNRQERMTRSDQLRQQQLSGNTASENRSQSMTREREQQQRLSGSRLTPERRNSAETMRREQFSGTSTMPQNWRERTTGSERPGIGISTRERFGRAETGRAGGEFANRSEWRSGEYRYGVNGPVGFSLTVGAVVPRTVRLEALPPRVLATAPQYRGYKVAIVHDRYVVVQPRTMRVVAVLNRGNIEGLAGSSAPGTFRQIALTERQRMLVRERIHLVAQHPTARVAFPLRVGAFVPASVPLRPMPAAIVEVVPQLRGFDYVVVRDEVVIVQPSRLRIVAIIPT